MKFYSLFSSRKLQRTRQSITLLLGLSFILPNLIWAFEVPERIHSLSSIPESWAVPEKYGKIIRTYKGDERLIIHIQDLHCHERVQRNIAGLIGYWAEAHAVRLVGQEGAFGTIDSDPLRSIPFSPIRDAVSNFFLRQGRLTGAEWYAAMGTAPIRLEGIDSQVLYRESEESLHAFLNAETQGLCEDLRGMLDALKVRVYSPALRQWDEARMAWRSGKTDTLGYARQLTQRAAHFDVAYADFATLVRLLTSVHPASDQADSDRLFYELAQLESRGRNRLYTTPEQSQLDEWLRRLDIVEKMLNISAAPEDLQAYRCAPDVFRSTAFLAFIHHHRLGDEETLADEEYQPLDVYLEKAAHFYTLADARSAVFVENTLACMARQGTRSAVMVTGGFHTAGIVAELQHRGVSYVEVAPALDAGGVVNPYFTLLQNHKTPLEKLLAHNQTFLALRTALADPLFLMQVELLVKPLTEALQLANEQPAAWKRYLEKNQRLVSTRVQSPEKGLVLLAATDVGKRMPALTTVVAPTEELSAALERDAVDSKRLPEIGQTVNVYASPQRGEDVLAILAERRHSFVKTAWGSRMRHWGGRMLPRWGALVAWVGMQRRYVRAGITNVLGLNGGDVLRALLFNPFLPELALAGSYAAGGRALPWFVMLNKNVSSPQSASPEIPRGGKARPEQNTVYVEDPQGAETRWVKKISTGRAFGLQHAKAYPNALVKNVWIDNDGTLSHGGNNGLFKRTELKGERVTLEYRDQRIVRVWLGDPYPEPTTTHPNAAARLLYVAGLKYVEGWSVDPMAVQNTLFVPRQDGDLVRLEEQAITGRYFEQGRVAQQPNCVVKNVLLKPNGELAHGGNPRLFQRSGYAAQPLTVEYENGILVRAWAGDPFRGNVLTQPDRSVPLIYVHTLAYAEGWTRVDPEAVRNTVHKWGDDETLGEIRIVGSKYRKKEVAEYPDAIVKNAWIDGDGNFSHGGLPVIFNRGKYRNQSVTAEYRAGELIRVWLGDPYPDNTRLLPDYTVPLIYVRNTQAAADWETVDPDALRNTVWLPASGGGTARFGEQVIAGMNYRREYRTRFPDAMVTHVFADQIGSVRQGEQEKPLFTNSDLKYRTDLTLEYQGGVAVRAWAGETVRGDGTWDEEVPLVWSRLPEDQETVAAKTGANQAKRVYACLNALTVAAEGSAEPILQPVHWFQQLTAQGYAPATVERALRLYAFSHNASTPVGLQTILRELGAMGLVNVNTLRTKISQLSEAQRVEAYLFEMILDRMRWEGKPLFGTSLKNRRSVLNKGAAWFVERDKLGVLRYLQAQRALGAPVSRSVVTIALASNVSLETIQGYLDLVREYNLSTVTLYRMFERSRPLAETQAHIGLVDRHHPYFNTFCYEAAESNLPIEVLRSVFTPEQMKTVTNLAELRRLLALGFEQLQQSKQTLLDARFKTILGEAARLGAEVGSPVGDVSLPKVAWMERVLAVLDDPERPVLRPADRTYIGSHSSVDALEHRLPLLRELLQLHQQGRIRLTPTLVRLILEDTYAENREILDMVMQPNASMINLQHLFQHRYFNPVYKKNLRWLREQAFSEHIVGSLLTKPLERVQHLYELTRVTKEYPSFHGALLKRLVEGEGSLRDLAVVLRDNRAQGTPMGRDDLADLLKTCLSAEARETLQAGMDAMLAYRAELPELDRRSVRVALRYLAFRRDLRGLPLDDLFNVISLHAGGTLGFEAAGTLKTSVLASNANMQKKLEALQTQYGTVENLNTLVARSGKQNRTLWLTVGVLLYSFDERIRQETKVLLLRWYSASLKHYERQGAEEVDLAVDLLLRAMELYDLYHTRIKFNRPVAIFPSYARVYLSFVEKNKYRVPNTLKKIYSAAMALRLDAEQDGEQIGEVDLARKLLELKFDIHRITALYAYEAEKKASMTSGRRISSDGEELDPFAKIGTIPEEFVDSVDPYYVEKYNDAGDDYLTLRPWRMWGDALWIGLATWLSSTLMLPDAFGQVSAWVSGLAGLAALLVHAPRMYYFFRVRVRPPPHDPVWVREQAEGVLRELESEWSREGRLPQGYVRPALFLEAAPQKGLTAWLQDIRLGRAVTGAIVLHPGFAQLPRWAQRAVLTHEVYEGVGRGHWASSVQEYLSLFRTWIRLSGDAWGRLATWLTAHPRGFWLGVTALAMGLGAWLWPESWHWSGLGGADPLAAAVMWGGLVPVQRQIRAEIFEIQKRELIPSDIHTSVEYGARMAAAYPECLVKHPGRTVKRGMINHGGQSIRVTQALEGMEAQAIEYRQGEIVRIWADDPYPENELSKPNGAARLLWFKTPGDAEGWPLAGQNVVYQKKGTRLIPLQATGKQYTAQESQAVPAGLIKYTGRVVNAKGLIHHGGQTIRLSKDLKGTPVPFIEYENGSIVRMWSEDPYPDGDLTHPDASAGLIWFKSPAYARPAALRGYNTVYTVEGGTLVPQETAGSWEYPEDRVKAYPNAWVKNVDRVVKGGRIKHGGNEVKGLTLYEGMLIRVMEYRNGRPYRLYTQDPFPDNNLAHMAPETALVYERDGRLRPQQGRRRLAELVAEARARGTEPRAAALLTQLVAEHYPPRLADALLRPWAGEGQAWLRPEVEGMLRQLSARRWLDRDAFNTTLGAIPTAELSDERILQEVLKALKSGGRPLFVSWEAERIAAKGLTHFLTRQSVWEIWSAPKARPYHQLIMAMLLTDFSTTSLANYLELVRQFRLLPTPAVEIFGSYRRGLDVRRLLLEFQRRGIRGQLQWQVLLGNDLTEAELGRMLDAAGKEAPRDGWLPLIARVKEARQIKALANLKAIAIVLARHYRSENLISDDEERALRDEIRAVVRADQEGERTLFLRMLEYVRAAGLDWLPKISPDDYFMVHPFDRMQDKVPILKLLQRAVKVGTGRLSDVLIRAILFSEFTPGKIRLWMFRYSPRFTQTTFALILRCGRPAEEVDALIEWAQEHAWSDKLLGIMLDGAHPYDPARLRQWSGWVAHLSKVQRNGILQRVMRATLTAEDFLRIAARPEPLAREDLLELLRNTMPEGERRRLLHSLEVFSSRPLRMPEPSEVKNQDAVFTEYLQVRMGLRGIPTPVLFEILDVILAPAVGPLRVADLKGDILLSLQADRNNLEQLEKDTENIREDEGDAFRTRWNRWNALTYSLDPALRKQALKLLFQWYTPALQRYENWGGEYADTFVQELNRAFVNYNMYQFILRQPKGTAAYFPGYFSSNYIKYLHLRAHALPQRFYRINKAWRRLQQEGVDTGRPVLPSQMEVLLREAGFLKSSIDAYAQSLLERKALGGGPRSSVRDADEAYDPFRTLGDIPEVFQEDAPKWVRDKFNRHLFLQPLRSLALAMFGVLITVGAGTIFSPDAGTAWLGLLGGIAGLGMVALQVPRLYYFLRMFGRPAPEALSEDQVADLEALWAEVRRAFGEPGTAPRLVIQPGGKRFVQALRSGELLGSASTEAIAVNPRIVNLPRWAQRAVLIHEWVELQGRGHLWATLSEYLNVLRSGWQRVGTSWFGRRFESQLLSQDSVEARPAEAERLRESVSRTQAVPRLPRSVGEWQFAPNESLNQRRFDALPWVRRWWIMPLQGLVLSLMDGLRSEESAHIGNSRDINAQASIRKMKLTHGLGTEWLPRNGLLNQGALEALADRIVFTCTTETGWRGRLQAQWLGYSESRDDAEGRLVIALAPWLWARVAGTQGDSLAHPVRGVDAWLTALAQAQLARIVEHESARQAVRHAQSMERILRGSRTPQERFPRPGLGARWLSRIGWGMLPRIYSRTLLSTDRSQLALKILDRTSYLGGKYAEWIVHPTAFNRQVLWGAMLTEISIETQEAQTPSLRTLFRLSAWLPDWQGRVVGEWPGSSRVPMVLPGSWTLGDSLEGLRLERLLQRQGIPPGTTAPWFPKPPRKASEFDTAA